MPEGPLSTASAVEEATSATSELKAAQAELQATVAKSKTAKSSVDTDSASDKALKKIEALGSAMEKKLDQAE